MEPLGDRHEAGRRGSCHRTAGSRRLSGSFALPDAPARQERTVKQIEKHVQSLIRGSDRVRDQFFLLSVMPELGDAKWNTDKNLPTKNADRFVEGAKRSAKKYHRSNRPLQRANASANAKS